MDSALDKLLGNAKTGNLDPIFGSQHAIWVPPEVEVKALPLYEGVEDTPSIVYPVPEAWGIDATATDMAPLQEMGWQCKRETSGLLSDFLRLVREDETNKVLDKVKVFAQKWGPLWLCRTPGHIRRGFGDCYWSPAWPFMPYADSIHEEPCSWHCFEPAFEFVVRARKAKAVLDAAVKLQNHESVPKSMWIQLHADRIIEPQSQPLRGWSFLIPQSSQAPVALQKLILSLIVNEHLSTLGTPRLWLHWAQNPALKIACGLGCLRAIWVEIAQILGDVKSFHFCEACGTPFLRKRKQKYCPDCRENDKGAKMMSARRRRDRERQEQP